MHVIQSRINLLLEEKDEPQNWLAKRSGVTPATISRICNGTSIPGGDILGQIADAFGVSADYLLGRTIDRRVSSRQDEVDYIITKTYHRLTEHDKGIMLAVMRDYLHEDEVRLIAGRKAGNMVSQTGTEGEGNAQEESE